MFLASLRGSGSQTFFSVTQGRPQVASTVTSPGGTTELLVTVLNRADGEHFGTGDQVELRSVQTFNLLGCLVDHAVRVVLHPQRSPLGNFFVDARVNPRREFLATRRTISANFPIPIAVDSLAQQVFVEEASFVEPAQGRGLVHQRIRLSIKIPIVIWYWLAEPEPPLGWQPPPHREIEPPEPPACGVPEGSLRLIPFPGGGWSGWQSPGGFGSAISAPEPVLKSVRCFLARGTDGALELVAAPHGDERDWLEVVLSPIRARLRDPAGRYLSLAAVTYQLAVESSRRDSDWRFNFTLTKLQAPSSRALSHGDKVWLRAPHGALLKSNIDGATSAPVEIQPPRATTEGLSLTVFREAGEGLVSDGDRVLLVAGDTPVNPRLTVTASGGWELASGPGTPFILEFTQEYRWGRDSAGNHTSITLPLPRELEDRGTVGKVFIGCPMHGSPLARWTLPPSSETLVSGLFQHLPPSDGAGAGTAPPSFAGIDGYILSEPALGTVPVKAYARGPHRQVFLTVRADQERAADDEGYTFGWIEGHAYATPPARPTPGTDSTDGGMPRVILRRGLLDALIRGSTVGRTLGTLLGRFTTLPGVIRTDPPRPLRALVLSGGGAKGCFEAGAVQALFRHWRPDIICGVSVGSVNAIKLAEGGAGDDLVEMWRDFGSTRNAIFLRNYYLDVLEVLADRAEGKLGDVGIASGIAGLLSLGLPLLLGGSAAALTALIAKDLSGLDPAIVRIMNYTLNLIHGLHSMEPLRRLLRDQTNPRAVAQSGIALRLGMTDLGTGQYFNVTEPDETLGDDLIRFGRIECEPDHQLGGSWLTNPIYGADEYLMPLDHAVYSSSTLPVFMDPLRFDLGAALRVERGGLKYVSLEGALPPGLNDLLSLTDPAANGRPDFRPESWPAARCVDGQRWEDLVDQILRTHFSAVSPSIHRADARARRDGDRGPLARARGIFDGGLRDTLPIRTALRMGATEIISISGDRLCQTSFPGSLTRNVNPQYANGVFSLLGGNFLADVDLGSIPALHNFMGMLNLFISEVARSDSLLAWSQAEFGNWMTRAAEQLPEERQRALRRQFDTYWRDRAEETVQAMGATSWTGGRKESVRTPWGKKCSITHIFPPRDFIDALAFDDGTSIDDGIRLGAEAAKFAWRYVRS